MENEWKQINVLSIDDCLGVLEHILNQHGENLTSAMKATIVAAWENEKYEDYIEKNHLKLKSSTLRRKAHILYSLVSQTLGVEKIYKHNLRAVLHNLYFEGRLSKYSHIIKTSSPAVIASPTHSNFIGRDKELSELVQLLKSSRCINVWGAHGIGKSTLVREFIERQKFDLTRRAIQTTF